MSSIGEEVVAEGGVRSDAGRPRLTRRDLDALSWLEEMRSVYERDLAVLLGRLAGGGALSLAATRAVVRRWARLDVARAVKVMAHESRYVWLTSQGAALLGVAHWKEPGWAHQRHSCLVAAVRLWLERRGLAEQPVTGWTSERRWRQAHADAVRAGAHVPDALAHLADGRVMPIEVELADKGPSRTLEIAVRLTSSYDQVLYVVAAETQTARTVRGALDSVTRQLARPDDGRVSILELPVDMGGRQ